MTVRKAVSFRQLTGQYDHASAETVEKRYSFSSRDFIRKVSEGPQPAFDLGGLKVRLAKYRNQKVSSVSVSIPFDVNNGFRSM